MADPANAPASFVEPLVRVGKLSDEQFAQFVELLGASLVRGQKQSAVRDCAGRLGWAVKDTQDAFAVVTGIVGWVAFAAEDEDPPEIVRIATAPNLDLDELQRSKLQARLRQAIATKSMYVGAKATRLQLEFPHTVQDIRLLTDLRPVFTRGRNPEAAGMLISHSLSLEERPRGRGVADNVVRYTLDRDALIMLQRAVERALEKHDAMLNWLGKTDISVYSPTEREANSDDAD